jgi:flagellar hook-associated protein 3 FlgL
MRVTSNSFPNRLLEQLTRLTNRTNEYQAQAATGQRITRPEDDPAAMRRVLDMQAETAKLTQYNDNIDRHQELAAASFSAMGQVQNVVNKAGEIAVSAGGAQGPDALKALAVNVDSLIEQALQYSNTKNRKDYIFGGTNSDVPPFLATRDAQGKITSVAYQGNTELAENEVAEKVTLSAQTLGANTTGTGEPGLFSDSRSGADLFAHLIALRDSLEAGNVTQVQNVDSANIAKDEDSIIFHRGTNALTQARLEASKSVATQRVDSLNGLVSKETDVDLATVIMKLTQTQNAYKAALQSGGTILNQSLLDYLR